MIYTKYSLNYNLKHLKLVGFECFYLWWWVLWIVRIAGLIIINLPVSFFAYFPTAHIKKVLKKERKGRCRKMTERQKRFVEEYLIDLNATQAAIRAGYSPETAKEIGCENLTKPNIRARVDKAIAERSKRTGVNQDRVLLELARLGFVNPADLINMDEATIKDGANRDDTAAISSVKVKTIPTEDGNITEREVKLCDKNKSLELLARHLGMFNDKLDLSGDLNIDVSIDYGDG